MEMCLIVVTALLGWTDQTGINEPLSISDINIKTHFYSLCYV
jgi:hypothetical protein